MASRTPIIGLYGVSGCGKSFLLQELQRKLGPPYTFYEGSQVIADIVPGGLSAFQAATDAQKFHWRRLAINKIRDSSSCTGQPAIVAGHFMFWSEGDAVGQVVCTPDDLLVYTHIIYLDTPIPTYNILFIALRNPETIPDLLRTFTEHSNHSNTTLAKARLEEIFRCASLARGKGAVKTVVVLDADRTLGPFDTGSMLWELVRGGAAATTPCPLKTVFSSRIGYSFGAFCQAALVYQELICNESEEQFESHCRQVASNIQLYPEFVSLLQSVTQDRTVLPIVITCGLGRIWTHILRTALGSYAEALSAPHGVRVWAVGDSVLDLSMMMKADQAVVVVGSESIRSKSMDSALSEAIDQHGLRAVQVLLPSDKVMKPRLDIAKLPVVRFKGKDLFELRPRQPINTNIHSSSIMHATDMAAAKLLMTPTRDASLAGPALREAHRQVGRYLALQFVSEVVGLESSATPHVQNRTTEGYRLCSESKTTIVALMRGGEPMALGVSEVFPLSMFVHAKEPSDLEPHHVAGQQTVILVDCVVNSGKSIIDFVRHIRGSLVWSFLIVVVVGVAQADSVKGDGALAKCLEQNGKIRVVTLRLSGNKYTGRGGTDTGNRLFNTTHLD
ncbi:Uracil phosphoribosyltransferase domain containing protein [Naviculisporaceae sp. PSN 640]